MYITYHSWFDIKIIKFTHPELLNRSHNITCFQSTHWFYLNWKSNLQQLKTALKESANKYDELLEHISEFQREEDRSRKGEIESVINKELKSTHELCLKVGRFCHAELDPFLVSYTTTLCNSWICIETNNLIDNVKDYKYLSLITRLCYPLKQYYETCYILHECAA